MKKYIAKLIPSTILASGMMILASSCQAHDSKNESDNYVYQTKLGAVYFLYDETHTGTPSKLVKLGKQVLLKAVDPNNENAYRPRYMEEFGSEQLSNIKTKDGVPLILKMIVAEGEDGNCIRQFIVLDFTGAKPYASKPFGYNPDGTACLEFKKVKWGKDVSYIYLEGPMKYAYHTGGAVIGPLE